MRTWRLHHPLWSAPALVAGLVGAFLAVVPTARAETPSYVALGDSYAAGTGTRTYLADGTTCQRSVYAYPALLASAMGYALTFRACSGATIPDVSAVQLSALSTTTDHVTVSVGGNDAGFAGVLTACAQPRWAADCHGAIDRSERFVRRVLPGALASLYASIRSRAPSAEVVVVGYPRTFNGTDCNALTWFSASEMTRLNATSDLLNTTTSAAARAAGFSFAGPRKRFLGHAVCDSPEWINGLSSPLSASYHPKRAGHRYGYLPVVGSRVTGTALTASTAVLEAARASGDHLAQQQRRYAGRDQVIEPETFPAPRR